ncbi:MAG: class II aldolase/adducin family protein [Anaerolineae bacterium]|nr:class II aldolase/adducin family protein [Anaerolineae bacterium]
MIKQTKQDILAQLIWMSHELGRPELDYAILGEGNVSARIDDETFLVKASGAELRTLDENGLVEVSLQRALALLDAEDISDASVKAGLVAAKVDPTATRHPSVETVLHALALTAGGATWVGHTHPTAVNAVLCSQAAESAYAGRLFPDEIVVCGPAPVFVPYTDPGVPLARCVREKIQAYMEEWGQPPKVILMQNHGLIALGSSPQEVLNITAMAVKVARVLLGTYALGGPRFLTEQQVTRIHTRPDEALRRRMLGLK